VRVKQHNVVAYVPHADTATCEVNDVELDEATTRWSFGDEVEGLYTFADGGKRRWFFAVVEAVMDAGQTYTLTYEYVPDTSVEGRKTVEGVTAVQIRARPRRSRGVNRKDDDATTRAYKTTCKAQQGQVNKSAVTLGLVLGEEEGAVQLAPLWHVQGVSSEEAYRVVPAVPQLRVSHAAIVSGLRCEKDLAFKRPLENRVVPFAVYSISLNWVAGVEALAAQRVSTNAS
jgi:hypothetical protein